MVDEFLIRSQGNSMNDSKIFFKYAEQIGYIYGEIVIIDIHVTDSQNFLLNVKLSLHIT